MVTRSTLVLVGSVALVTTVVAVLQHGRPGPERRHLFETDDRERANPFGDLPEGARDRAEADGCRACDTRLESTSFRYCVSCGTRSVADD